MFGRILNEYDKSIDSDKNIKNLELINNLGVIWYRLGNITLAKEYWSRSSNGFTNLLGIDHKDTIIVLNNLNYLSNSTANKNIQLIDNININNNYNNINNLQTCAVCKINKPNLSKCGRCKVTYYCSEEHQKQVKLKYLLLYI
jgi:hypothetical protein